MAYDDIARVQEMNFTISTWERLPKLVQVLLWFL